MELPCDDDGDRAAAVRPLMLGAAGDEDLGVADEAGERAGDEGAGVAGRGNVAVVEHRVAVAAQDARRARLPPWRAARRACARCAGAAGRRGEPEPRQRRAHRLDVERVAHHRMVDAQRPGPAREAPSTTIS